MIFTPEKTKGLAICLRDMLPVKLGNSFHPEHWEKLLTRLREEYDCDATKAQVKNKHDELRKKYTVFHNLIHKNTSGNAWNPETGTIDVTDEFWSDYIKKNPLAEKFKFRERPFELYDIMDEIINGACISIRSRSKRKRSNTGSEDLERIEEEPGDDEKLDTSNQLVPTTPLSGPQLISPTLHQISESPPQRKRKTECSMLAEAIERLISGKAKPVMSIEAAQRVDAVRLVNSDYKDWNSDDRALALRVMKDEVNVQIFIHTEAGETRDKWLRLEIEALK